MKQSGKRYTREEVDGNLSNDAQGGSTNRASSNKQKKKITKQTRAWTRKPKWQRRQNAWTRKPYGWWRTKTMMTEHETSHSQT